MLKKRFFLGIILFISSAHTIAASCIKDNYIGYHRDINEAHYYFYNNDLKKAKLYFDMAFQKVNVYFEKDLLLYSVCLWDIGERDDALEILDTNLYTEIGLNPSHYFKDMSDSLRNQLLARNNKFLDDKVGKDKNSTLYKLIDSLYLLDRDIRLRMNAYERGEYIESQVKKAFEDSMVKLRDETFTILDSIFAKHGYLGGINWNSRFQVSILMLHSSPKWVKKNKKFLYHELKKGHIHPYDYAVIIDRKMYCEKGEDSYYKQWIRQDEKEKLTGKEFFTRSNSIGLSPYFVFTERIPGENKFPDFTDYYEKFKENKDNFNCSK